MFFDIPIVARADTAVAETLGEAGVLVDVDADAFEIAAVAREILTDGGLRERIVRSQRERRVSFLPERILPIVDAFVADIA
jgi:glycosyltransferase involved in cell wall biosynthesis